MKKLVLLICLIGIFPAAGAQPLTHYLAEFPESPKYLDGIIVSDIVYPGQDFRGLEKFGTPEKRQVRTEGEYTSWLISYKDFQLEFIDMYGEPELKRLRIHGPSSTLLFQTEKLVVGTPVALIMDNAAFRQIEGSETEQQKMREMLQYLEVLVESSGYIQEIIYRRDPSL